MVIVCQKYLITDEMIGRGSFSQVFKGRHQNSNEIVAIWHITLSVIVFAPTDKNPSTSRTGNKQQDTKRK